jgi:hypothetical protein
MFLISEDKTNGVDVLNQNGVFTFEIPQSGHLMIRHIEIFDRPCKEVAFYKDGTQILDQNGNVPCRFYSLGVVSEGVVSERYYFYAGTYSNFDAVQKSWEWWKLPLGKSLEPDTKKR